MGNFLSEEELKNLGLKAYGKDVLIGRHAVLYSPQSLSVGNHVRIDDFTIISGNVTLGDYIHVSQFCGLYGGEAGIEMEDFSGLSSKCSCSFSLLGKRQQAPWRHEIILPVWKAESYSDASCKMLYNAP